VQTWSGGPKQVAMELLVILLVTLLVVPVVLLATGPFRIILGVVFLLFFPGYTLMSALFPREDSMQRVERFVLSFVLSIALVILLALVINFTPWGVRVEPILAFLVIFIFVASYVALFRRRHLPEGERFEPRLGLSVPRWGAVGRSEKAASIVLVVVLAGAVGALVWAVATPPADEPFTDFYALGSEGMLMDYPREVTLGSQAEVTLGIVNHEREDAIYGVDVLVGERMELEIGPLSLSDGEEWQDVVALIPSEAGEDQKVEFLLYKGEDTEPYLNLHLWLDVREVE
jgi:uncharacterized membrane protein